MLEMLINALLTSIILVIIVTPFIFLKKHFEKKNYVDEKDEKYAEYDREFFEKLKKENEKNN